MKAGVAGVGKVGARLHSRPRASAASTSWSGPTSSNGSPRHRRRTSAMGSKRMRARSSGQERSETSLGPTRRPVRAAATEIGHDPVGPPPCEHGPRRRNRPRHRPRGAGGGPHGPHESGRRHDEGGLADVRPVPPRCCGASPCVRRRWTGEPPRVHRTRGGSIAAADLARARALSPEGSRAVRRRSPPTSSQAEPKRNGICETSPPTDVV